MKRDAIKDMKDELKICKCFTVNSAILAHQYKIILFHFMIYNHIPVYKNTQKSNFIYVYRTFWHNLTFDTWIQRKNTGTEMSFRPPRRPLTRHILLRKGRWERSVPQSEGLFCNFFNPPLAPPLEGPESCLTSSDSPLFLGARERLGVKPGS